MDLEPARVVQTLLDLGLVITTTPTPTGCKCRITGGKTVATGVGDSMAEALIRSAWRWVLN
jgi:hypothetical protein